MEFARVVILASRRLPRLIRRQRVPIQFRPLFLGTLLRRRSIVPDFAFYPAVDAPSSNGFSSRSDALTIGLKSVTGGGCAAEAALCLRASAAVVQASVRSMMGGGWGVQALVACWFWGRCREGS